MNLNVSSLLNIILCTLPLLMCSMPTGASGQQRDFKMILKKPGKTIICTKNRDLTFAKAVWLEYSLCEYPLIIADTHLYILPMEYSIGDLKKSDLNIFDLPEGKIIKVEPRHCELDAYDFVIFFADGREYVLSCVNQTFGSR